VVVTRSFGDGLETRKAIYKYYPKALGKAYVVDPEACTRCGKCLDVCDPDAIDLDAQPVAHTVEAGAVVLAPGAEIFPTETKEEYGFGRYANVLSAVKFERMLATGSPTAGTVRRISDGQLPSSLAFIQCVGSRDAEIGQGHCSSVCCMFSLKQARFAKERHPELDVAIYYMDLRAFGKDYEDYIREAETAGIRFVRAIPSIIRQEPGSEDLTLQIAGDGAEAADVTHSMVVLASGFCQQDATRTLAGTFGVELGEGGFAAGPEFAPCETNVPGIFTCGAFREPKDIPESTGEAACAANLAAQVLAAPTAAGEMPMAPTPADFRGEVPAIGVFLCTCEGFNEKQAEFPALEAAVANMPGVSFVETVTHACSKVGMGDIRRIFGEKEPNRLVLGACSYRIVDQLYGHMLKNMGIHPGVLEIANLREACLENPSENGNAQEAARATLTQAVRSSWYTGFAPTVRESVEQTALVIGGGAAGMRVALDLTSLGHSVHLVEQHEVLGGNLGTARFTLKGGDTQALLKDLESKVRNHEQVQVYTGARVAAAQGRVGAFRTELETAEGPVEILHGAVAFATGASEVKPSCYGYADSPKVITQKELEGRLADGEVAVKSVVMIQCVESRELAEGCRPYCSRVCCTHALKNALKLLDAGPETQVTVLYRDLRAYGANEHFYRAARDRGVLFVPFELDQRPTVTAGDQGVSVRYVDPGLGGEVTDTPDLLVLSTGMAPDDVENRRLAGLYGVETDANGFFREKSAKAATTDFTVKGVYMAGLCHAPKHIEESLAQAGAAAGRCSALLSKDRSSSEKASYVVDKLCSRCGICVDVCPYNARSLDMEDTQVAVVDVVACEACGACTMACPNKAAQQYGFAPKQFLLGLDELLG
jgi:heterodisulfide reductase subunit A